MKKSLGILSVLGLAFGLVVADMQVAEAGSRRNAAIAGAIIGGAVAGAAASHRYRGRRSRRYYDDYDYVEYEAERSCRRVRRCSWKRGRVIWRHGRRYRSDSYRSCRNVTVCR